MNRDRVLIGVFAITFFLSLFVGAIPSYAERLQTYTASLQVGEYTDYCIYGPYAGLMREDGSAIGRWDDTRLFASPSHVQADFLWFTHGWMAWDYPLEIPTGSRIEVLRYTVELASEYPAARWNWPSDVTLSIDGVDVSTWKIPGDPDARYGYARQENHLSYGITQYGWLVTWTVDRTGTYLEYQFRLGNAAKTKVSDLTIDDLAVTPGQDVRIKLSVPYRSNSFGLNMFGDHWGDYDYDPTISIDYVPPIDALVDLLHDVLNARSRGWVACSVELPQGFNPADIDVSTVSLDGVVFAAMRPALVRDYDGDGIRDLMIRFDRQAIINHLEQENIQHNETAEVTVGGMVAGIPFEGRETVRFIANEKRPFKVTR